MNQTTTTRVRCPRRRAEFIAQEREALRQFHHPRAYTSVRYECQSCGRFFTSPAAVYDHDCEPTAQDDTCLR